MNEQYQNSPPLEPHRGTAVLVLGILSLVCSCVLLGIIAWVMGSADLKQMDAGVMDPSGRGNTQAGKICGMISVILSIIVLAVMMLFLLIMAFAAMMH